jgi:hypothetical protein
MTHRSKSPPYPPMATIHPLHNAEGRPVLVLSQLEKKYSVCASFTKYWSRKKSLPHPPEPALRSSEIANTHPFGGDGPRCKSWWVEDAERILRGEEGRTDRLGSGRRRPERLAYCRLGLPDDAASKALLKEYLTPGPRTAREVQRWAREKKITRRRLYRAKAALQVSTRAPR